MGQRICIAMTILLAAVVLACDKPGDANAPRAADGIVSLSPAATDLLIQLGLTDRIVGVSAYEADPTVKARLPVVGDYERIDWEKIAQLKPRHLIVQGQPQRLPEGLKERCQAAGVELINIQIDRLDDISAAASSIAQTLGLDEARPVVLRRMQNELDALATTGKTPALILLSENGKFVAGKDTFLDDLLTRAGGVNVIKASGYPTIDQELLLTLQPEVIFILLPGANPTTVASAKAALGTADSLPAVRNNRVYVIDRANVLLPSHSNAVKLLEELAEQVGEKPA